MKKAIFKYNANYFRVQRQTLGLSQFQVAEVCSCGSQFISNIENGKCSTLMVFARAFHKHFKLDHRKYLDGLSKVERIERLKFMR